MSVDATSRAWKSGAGGNDLLVLLALADHAGGQDDPYDYAYPAVGRLAEMTNVSPRTVQRCLRSLEERRLIVKTGEHVWGRGKVTTQYRIVVPGDDDAADDQTGRQNDGGDSGGGGGATPVSPNPSKEPVQRDEGNAQARDREQPDPRDSLPDDFPDELKPHARHVFRVLRDIAVQHGAKEVRPLSLGRLMMGQPRRPFVATAHELHVWAADPPRPIKDVVATYATFLRRTHDLAAVERLDAEGMPTTGPAAAPPGVTPIRRGAMSNAERVEAQIQALRAAGSGRTPAGSDTFGSA